MQHAACSMQPSHRTPAIGHRPSSGNQHLQLRIFHVLRRRAISHSHHKPTAAEEVSGMRVEEIK